MHPTTLARLELSVREQRLHFAVGLQPAHVGVAHGRERREDVRLLRPLLAGPVRDEARQLALVVQLDHLRRGVSSHKPLGSTAGKAGLG